MLHFSRGRVSVGLFAGLLSSYFKSYLVLQWRIWNVGFLFLCLFCYSLCPLLWVRGAEFISNLCSALLVVDGNSCWHWKKQQKQKTFVRGTPLMGNCSCTVRGSRQKNASTCLLIACIILLFVIRHWQLYRCLHLKGWYLMLMPEIIPASPPIAVLTSFSKLFWNCKPLVVGMSLQMANSFFPRPEIERPS